MGAYHCGSVHGLPLCVISCHGPSCLQAQDVIALTKELQLLHVTKEFQQLIKAGPEARASGAREHSSLEGLYKARQTLQAKRIEERRRKMRHVEDEISAKVRVCWCLLRNREGIAVHMGRAIMEDH